MWCNRKSVPYEKFKQVPQGISKERKYFTVKLLTWISALICVSILLMSLLIAIVAGTEETLADNEIALALRMRKLQSHQTAASADATTTTIPQSITTTETLRLPLHVATPVGEGRQLGESVNSDYQQQLRRKALAKFRTTSKAKFVAELRAARPKEQRSRVRQQEQKLLHAAGASESARLLERAGAGGGGGGGSRRGGGVGAGPAHAQPIYGTWRTKARRPQQQQLIAAAVALPPTAAAMVRSAKAMPSTAATAVSMPVEATTPSSTGRQSVAATASAAPSATAFIMGDAKRHDVNGDGDGDGTIASHNRSSSHNDYQHHVYEPLPPKSSSTGTSTAGPLVRSSDLHDQIPRPPRLASRQPSLVVRRQYLETPSQANYAPVREDYKPKPFHFPYDGPLPEEFKKAEAERAEVNNIQDILQQMQLGGAPHRAAPQLMMMPSGLHIAGSFKNLKSSGIMNFFRGKRNNNGNHKHMQFAFPVPLPMQMFGAYQAPVFTALAPSPYQSRIAMDQFYAFKPRSPAEINLLAMQQHQQQLKTGAGRSKGSKKKQKKAAAIANANLMLQHSNQRPFAAAALPGAEAYMNSYAHLLAYNATQKPKLKHLPLKVNLDIYPVMPPSRALYAAPYALDEGKFPPPPPPLRPASAMRNPYADYYGQQSLTPSATALVYNAGSGAGYEPQQSPLHNPIKFPSAAQPSLQLPQASNLKVAFPDQASRYYQQQQQQQYQQLQQQRQQLQRPASVAAHPSYHSAADCVQPGNGLGVTAAPNTVAKSNQMMVHLNVFPKQRPHSAAPAHSTNPFYGSTFNVNRQTIREEEPEREPRELPPHPSSASLQPSPGAASQQKSPIARSDNFDPLPYNEPFEPILAGGYSDRHQRPHTVISNKLDNASALSPHYDHIETRYNHNHNPNGNYNHNYNEYDTQASVERLAAEAQTASLFRFPVEDLIKFQVDDAL